MFKPSAHENGWILGNGQRRFRIFFKLLKLSVLNNQGVLKMAYGIIHFYPNGTKAQYDAVVAAVHPDGGARLPAGQLYHAAGPSPGGWSIVAIHDSKESWEKFLSTVLSPVIQSQLKGGFKTEPQATYFEVDHLQKS